MRFLEILKDLVRNVVLIILLTTFLDMLLPSSSMQRFIKVVMGLFLLVTLLNPLLILIKEEQDFEVFAWQQNNQVEGSFNSVLTQGQHLETVNQELIKAQYQQRLQAQIKALVRLIKGAEGALVEVTLKEGEKVGLDNEIEKVLIRISKIDQVEESSIVKQIDPINIKVEQEEKFLSSKEEEKMHTPLSEEEKRVTTEINNKLTHYFGLKSGQISVVFS